MNSPNTIAIGTRLTADNKGDKVIYLEGFSVIPSWRMTIRKTEDGWCVEESRPLLPSEGGR